MPSLSFEVRGSNRVANKLRTAAAKFPDRAEKVVSVWAKQTRATLKSTPYPAKRAGQTYVRTGNLANRWSAQKVKNGVWKIDNSAHYASYVVGDNQAWMHVGRWWKARDKIQEQAPKLTRALTVAILKDLE